MERILSFNRREAEHRSVPWNPGRLSNKLADLSNWLLDRGRQLRALPRDPDLIEALLTADTLPAGFARFRLGEVLNPYSLDGEHRELKICGIRSNEFANFYTVIDLGEMKPYILRENRTSLGNERHANEQIGFEAALSLRLGPHAHIVNTSAVYEFDGLLFLLTEYVAGTNLDVQLKHQPMELFNVLKYSIHLCRALHHANTLLPGFVHGDVRPQNCFITNENSLKLGGFRHVSLSIFENEHETAGDIFEFGLTLLEMLSGVRPLRTDLEGKAAAIVLPGGSLQQLRTERNVPLRVIDLIAGCFAKSLKSGPAVWSSLESELQEIALAQFDQCIPTGALPQIIERDLIRRAISLASIGRANDAVGFIDKVAGDFSHSPEFLASKAIILTTAGCADEAYSASTSALMLNSNSFVVLLGHARVLILRGNLEAAAGYLERALRLRPSSHMALGLLEDVLTKLSEYS